VLYSHSFQDGNIATCPLEFGSVRHVFHLAGKAFVPESWQAPHGFYEVNVLGTANVLDFCRRQSASVTLISSYVYGKPLRLPIDEDHPLEPFNPYSHTKILAEEIGRYYAAQFGVPVFIVRPFNVYGPGQDRRFLIPTLIPGSRSSLRTD
jgi:nucleoside-diphosphate-sugar epimerase